MVEDNNSGMVLEPDSRCMELWGPPGDEERADLPAMIKYLASQWPRTNVADQVIILRAQSLANE